MKNIRNAFEDTIKIRLSTERQLFMIVSKKYTVGLRHELGRFSERTVIVNFKRFLPLIVTTAPFRFTIRFGHFLTYNTPAFK